MSDSFLLLEAVKCLPDEKVKQCSTLLTCESQLTSFGVRLGSISIPFNPATTKKQYTSKSSDVHIAWNFT